MAEFLVLTFMVCVAPLLVLVVIESNARRSEHTDRGERSKRPRPIVSRFARPGWRASDHDGALAPEELSRSCVRACTYTGPWEDGSWLSDFVTEQIRCLSHPR